MHVQEAICGSLEEYNKHIDDLKQEMEEATESAKRIREDIQEMRNKYGVVDSQEKCAACDFPLLNRPFYLFLCGHVFHYDCLFQVRTTSKLDFFQSSHQEKKSSELSEVHSNIFLIVTLGSDSSFVSLQAKSPGRAPEEAGRHNAVVQITPPSSAEGRRRHFQPGEGHCGHKPRADDLGHR